MRLSNSQDVSLIQRVLMTLVPRLIMNDGFSIDSSITCSELFRVSWVNLGYIADDRRQNLKPKFAQVPEPSDFAYGVYLGAHSTFNLPTSWPLQDIRSLQSCLALVQHPCIAPSIYIAHTIALRLHG